MITNSVKKISDIVGEITQSSMEQANGIEQINQAISQIDEVTQHNGQLVEKSLPERYHSLIPMNEKALERGMEIIHKV